MGKQHRNAPLTPEGRRRLCERIDGGRPICHVATEAGVSRRMLGKWYGRWLEFGEEGLQDLPSRPKVSPNETPPETEARVVAMRRHTKWGAQRIAAALGNEVSSSTVQRILEKHGISRLRDMDLPTGNTSRDIIRYEHAGPGDMVHVDVKKVGKIPKGGGWAVHGIGSEKAKASNRKANKRPGYTYLHAAIDDHSRLAYVETLEDERGVTAAAFWRRARAFFELHGIVTVHRVLTDCGSAYRSRAFNVALDEANTVHKFTRPYTPKTNGKVERFNRTMKDEWLNVRAYNSEEERRAALADFLNYYNHERAHSGLRYSIPSERVPIRTYRLRAEEPIVVEQPIPDEQLTLDDYIPDPEKLVAFGEVQRGKSHWPQVFDHTKLEHVVMVLYRDAS